MRFIIDAQLPRRLQTLLRAFGHDALHSQDLPAANRTPDSEIAGLAVHEDRIVISKDRDSVDSFVLSGRPKNLLWITTGNIHNDALLKLFENNLPAITAAFAHASFVELSPTQIIVHR